MTFTPEKDLAEHVRLIAVFEDGTTDVFAIPECSLEQGPMPIARIVAHEWQTDGYIKPGKIVGVRRLMTEEFLSDMFGAAGSQILPYREAYRGAKKAG